MSTICKLFFQISPIDQIPDLSVPVWQLIAFGSKNVLDFFSVPKSANRPGVLYISQFPEGMLVILSVQKKKKKEFEGCHHTREFGKLRTLFYLFTFYFRHLVLILESQLGGEISKRSPVSQREFRRLSL